MGTEAHAELYSADPSLTLVSLRVIEHPSRQQSAGTSTPKEIEVFDSINGDGGNRTLP